MTRSHVPRLLLAAVVLTVAACADGDDSAGPGDATTTADGGGGTTESSTGSNSDVTHVFDGTAFTCEDALGIRPEEGCGVSTVQVWERWGENLPGYVNSGELGPLNDQQEFSFEDAAYAGVLACAFKHYSEPPADETDYIAFMQDPSNRTGLDHLGGTELLPAWFAADEYLCNLLSGGDIITP